MLSLDTILKIVKGAASAGPAFAELFGQVKTLFSEKDQATLQSAYDEAKATSDRAEDDFVKAGRGN